MGQTETRKLTASEWDGTQGGKADGATDQINKIKAAIVNAKERNRMRPIDEA